MEEVKGKAQHGVSFLLASMVVVVGLLVPHGVAKAGALCGMSREGFAACRPAVTATDPSTTTNPSDECCDALSKADLQCLCSYKNSILLPSMGIDPKLALALPTKCGLTPPNCIAS